MSSSIPRLPQLRIRRPFARPRSESSPRRTAVITSRECHRTTTQLPPSLSMDRSPTTTSRHTPQHSERPPSRPTLRPDGIEEMPRRVAKSSLLAGKNREFLDFDPRNAKFCQEFAILLAGTVNNRGYTTIFGLGDRPNKSKRDLAGQRYRGRKRIYGNDFYFRSFASANNREFNREFFRKSSVT